MTRKSSEKTPAKPSAGVKHVYHVISIIITALCSLALIALVNALTYRALRGSAELSQGLCAFFSSGAVSFFVSSKAALIICAALICVLLALNAFIYRHVVKKIFEHFSIVFTSAGAITLLFTCGFSLKELHFACALALLFTGAVLFLLYGIMYHRHG